MEDGGILSAPYDEETVAFSKDYVVGQTDPNFRPDKSVATVIANTPNTSPSQVVEAPRSGLTFSPHLFYAVAGLAAVLILGIAWLAMNNSKATDGSANTAKPAANVAAVAPARTATPAPTPRVVHMDVPATSTSVDSNITLNEGDVVEIDGSGSACHGTPCNGPEGNPNIKPDGDAVIPSARFGALAGRIGSGPAFVIGKHYRTTVPNGGDLKLFMNDTKGWYQDNSGSFQVKISVTRSNSQPTTTTKGSVPTTRQLQDELLKEAKRIEDEARRQ